MKRGDGLHPARPDCWPPTKRPRATPGGLIAASVTCLSRQEGVPPCLRTSPPLGGTLEVHRTSWRIPFPRPACTFFVLGFRGAWVSHAPPRIPKRHTAHTAHSHYSHFHANYFYSTSHFHTIHFYAIAPQ